MISFSVFEVTYFRLILWKLPSFADPNNKYLLRKSLAKLKIHCLKIEPKILQYLLNVHPNNENMSSVRLVSQREASSCPNT